MVGTCRGWILHKVTYFLSSLGRGKDTAIDRDSSPTLLGMLFMVNQYDVYQRSSEPYGAYDPINTAARISLSMLSDKDAFISRR